MTNNNKKAYLLPCRNELSFASLNKLLPNIKEWAVTLPEGVHTKEFGGRVWQADTTGKRVLIKAV